MRRKSSHKGSKVENQVRQAYNAFLRKRGLSGQSPKEWNTKTRKLAIERAMDEEFPII